MTTELVPIQEIEKMGTYLAKSGLFGFKTPEQAIAIMLVAQAEGRHPATVAMDYDVIQGRPALKTVCLQSRFQHAGGKIEWHQLDETVADATFSHPSGGSRRINWTIEMARKAKLADKDIWKAYPRAMLRSRCVSEGVRIVCPAVIGGMYTVDEMRDMPPEELQEPIYRGQAVREEPKLETTTPETASSPEEKPFYTEAQFLKNLDQWTLIIESGKKTPDQIIKTVSMKYSLTDEQQQTIRSISVAPEQEAASV